MPTDERLPNPYEVHSQRFVMSRSGRPAHYVWRCYLDNGSSDWVRCRHCNVAVWARTHDAIEHILGACGKASAREKANLRTWLQDQEGACSSDPDWEPARKQSRTARRGRGRGAQGRSGRSQRRTGASGRDGASVSAVQGSGQLRPAAAAATANSDSDDGSPPATSLRSTPDPENGDVFSFAQAGGHAPDEL